VLISDCRQAPTISQRTLDGVCSSTVDVCHVYVIEYRLSKHISDELSEPFPAALFGVYLTGTVGLSPENIIIVGDSAGGNLTLALVRYLVENAGLSPCAQSESRSE
jgi:acetyl esterase/lipase